jgi:hypothetical protein
MAHVKNDTRELRANELDEVNGGVTVELTDVKLSSYSWGGSHEPPADLSLAHA